ncbi:MAG: bifunctional 4-hydroxy-2-oxoglutarate aldolase/2-dehydro-3-deoxy-phosphogluconate aldolase [Eubacteriales bacterium]|nr:bifunctional 4-hydroxy-2-oxoglutarate aldolase/2-dehydro-3-deoxy-phosphogluconate aldolase [Eubacteriales bacterium]
MLDELSLTGLVPVIKVEHAKDAVPLCTALKRGGLPVAEITFRSDAALEAIRLIHEGLPDILLGAGTVLTSEQADLAFKAGARYIVTPGFNPTVVRHCLDKGYPVVPGCSSPSDIEKAMEMGLKAVKFFPAEPLGGAKMLRALLGPYSAMRFIPTGGINEKNLQDYLGISQVLACGGSWMVPGDAVEQRDWQRVERLTAQAVQAVLGMHILHVGVNNVDEAEALKAAQRLSLLTGWAIERDSDAGCFVGESFEIMKHKGRGTHGHIALKVNSVARARRHLENLGFVFDETTLMYTPDGQPRFIYLKEEIAGFGIHLLQ